MTNEARVNTVQLMRQPGLTKTIAFDARPADLDIEDERLTGPVRAELTATSAIDSVRLTGTVVVPWRSQCRRCAVSVEGETTAAVDELYQLVVTDEDAYPIEGDFIEVGPVVRQYTLLELPDGPLCRDDCAGLCPQCGADLNEQPCGCQTDTRDPRWAVLDDLQLEPGDDPELPR